MEKTRIEMLGEMFRLQLEEDKKVQKAHNITYQNLIDQDRYFFALLDEFGELNHEWKPGWCWWKKTAGEIEEEKVLEEFSDVTHFILSYCLAENGGEIPKYITGSSFYIGDLLYPTVLYGPTTTASLIGQYTADILGYVLKNGQTTIKNDQALIECWYILSMLYELDFETEVYEPYVKKNAVNQQRVKDGY